MATSVSEAEERYRRAEEILMLDFWATWCGPCVAMIPQVVKAYDENHDRGFEIIGISLDEGMTVDELKSWCAGRGMRWPQVYEGRCWDGAVARLYRMGAIPTMLLVDLGGRVQPPAIGDDLVRLVSSLVSKGV